MVYLIWFALCIWVGVAASNKGRSGLAWGVLAFLFSPLIIGIILACSKDLTVNENLTKVSMEQQLLKDRVVANEKLTDYRLSRVENDVAKLGGDGQTNYIATREQQARLISEGSKQCPACAEVIKEAAIKCKHCGIMLSEFKTVECPYCSELIMANDASCKHCNSILSGT
jgi:hypothetical protein